MSVDIELVIIENFFYDFSLLLCAFSLSFSKISWGKLCLSALVGGVFALIYPLLVLPAFLSILLKICVGFLLVFLAKSKKERGRYGLNGLFFFLCAFCFAGFTYAFSKAYIFPCFIILTFIFVKISKKIYRKWRFVGNFKACKVFYQDKEWETTGYIDSGNLARQNGLPVCFITPAFFCKIYDEDRGQVFNEICITTLAGKKKVQVFTAEISVDGKEKKPVYLGVSANMIKKGYEILLHSEMII